MKATQEQIDEWKKLHGTIHELCSEGKTCYIFSPLTKLTHIKGFMHALERGSFESVDFLLGSCWIDGDIEMKSDDKIKASLIDQVKDLVDLPDFAIEFTDEGATIAVEGKSCRVRMASRMDIKYAEQRNKAGRPLDTQIYLLERIAVDDLTEWRTDVPRYVSLLTAMDTVKERKVVTIKKL